MKKQMKTLGVVATSAALALGCAVPAFATSPTGSVGAETETQMGDAGEPLKSSTLVNVTGYDKSQQIVATIPVDLTVAAPTTGGAVIPPTANTYAISNGGELAIHVSNIKGEEVDSTKWALASEPATVAPYTTAATSGKAEATISLTAKNGLSDAINVTTTGQDVYADFVAAGETTKDGKVVPGGKINIELAGYAWPAKGATGASAITAVGPTSFGESATPAVKIIYTITAGDRS